MNFLGICHALSPALIFFDRLYNLLRKRIIQHFFLVDAITEQIVEAVKEYKSR